jgi:hypothetical protein
MRKLLGRLFKRPRQKGLEQLSPEELRQLKLEADHLAAAVNSTRGDLSPSDMERLRQLKQILEEMNGLS